MSGRQVVGTLCSVGYHPQEKDTPRNTSRVAGHSRGSSTFLGGLHFFHFPTVTMLTRCGMEMTATVESAASNPPRQEGVHHTHRPSGPR